MRIALHCMALLLPRALHLGQTDGRTLHHFNTLSGPRNKVLYRSETNTIN